MKHKLLFWKNGKLVRDASKCTLCGLCVQRCPHKALKMSGDPKNWKIQGICMRCGRCIRECPVQALSLDQKVQ